MPIVLTERQNQMLRDARNRWPRELPNTLYEQVFNILVPPDERAQRSGSGTETIDDYRVYVAIRSVLQKIGVHS